MDYRNLIKSNLKKEKMVAEVKETVKGTSKDIVSFLKNDVVGFVKEKTEKVNEIYIAKKEEFSRRSVYTYAISEVEKFIVKCNPSNEEPVVITKREIGDTDKTLSIAQILATYEMETEDKYINVLFDVLRVHFEDEEQLDVTIEDDKIKIFVKEEPVIEPVDEAVEEEVEPVEKVSEEDIEAIEEVKPNTDVEEFRNVLGDIGDCEDSNATKNEIELSDLEQLPGLRMQSKIMQDTIKAVTMKSNQDTAL